MQGISYAPAIDFLAGFFANTERAVELRSLPNSGEPGPRRPLFGRNPDDVEAHCIKWDALTRAMFFGCATRITGNSSGKREDVCELPAVWVDIDTLKSGLDKGAVLKAALSLPYQPSVVNDSGGGLHCYWLFNEPLDVRADQEGSLTLEASIVAVLKQLAGILAGDVAVCDLARIMRLPGTHNTKPEVMLANGNLPVVVRTVFADWNRRYELDDLIEWLDRQLPVVTEPVRPSDKTGTAAQKKAPEHDNPYLAAATKLGFKPPLDVEQALSAMTLRGTGNTSIHQTQLMVSASLVAQGVSDNEIVSLLIDATHAAAGIAGSRWNWVREETSIRAMVGSARKKYGPSAKPTPKAQAETMHKETIQDAAASGGNAAKPAVVSLAAERKRRSKDSDDSSSGDKKTPKKGDDELALAFAAAHANDLRYVAARGVWLHWDGSKWAEDRTRFALNAVRETLREICIADAKSPGSVALSAGTITAVEKLATADRRIAATMEAFDTDPWILNTPSGIVDLKTGALMPSDPTRHCSKSTTVTPERMLADDCPIWLGFLNRILRGDKDLIEYMQKLAGYTLTGLTREQQLWFLFGHGRNGKGTFMNTLKAILGDYAVQAAMATFTESQNESHPTELAALMGARMVVASETEEGRAWAENRIKSLTGGDAISARFMRQDMFTYTPQFKLWFAGNHKPTLRNVDVAMTARFNLVPFTVQIPLEERDLELADKLVKEYPSILRWCIDGCLKWQKSGLKRCAAITKESQSYIEDEDSFSRWLHECCVIDKAVVRPEEFEESGDLFESWKKWAESTREHIGNIKKFKSRMDGKGFEHGHHPTNKRAIFRGIRLTREAADGRYGS